MRPTRRLHTILLLAALAGTSTATMASEASAGPVWEGGQINCARADQASLAITYRGVLHIQWGETGGMRHDAGPYYSAFYTTLNFDTGAPVVAWRAEARPDNNNVPGDISDAYATCI